VLLLVPHTTVLLVPDAAVLAGKWQNEHKRAEGKRRSEKTGQEGRNEKTRARCGVSGGVGWVWAKVG
jgi:hypothetical protein